MSNLIVSHFHIATRIYTSIIFCKL